MCDEIVTLWTIKSPGFDLTSGKIDHSKSEYYLTTPNVKEAYKKLWNLLGTPDGQIVWCSTNNGDIVKTCEEKVLWELKIPRENVICFIDSLVWNRILERKCRVRNNISNQWLREAINKFPNDYESQDSYINQCEKDFWNKKPKTGSWWDELFVQNTGECIDAIIHYPVPETFVKNHIKWCCR